MLAELLPYSSTIAMATNYDSDYGSKTIETESAMIGGKATEPGLPLSQQLLTVDAEIVGHSEDHSALTEAELA